MNPVTINLVCEILSREDYIDSTTLILKKASRARSLLDLLINMLRNHSLPRQDSAGDIAWRAKRFMLKIISKTPVIPPSLIVTGVKISAKRNYIGGGGFGNVFKGKLYGTVVALKELYESDDEVVRHVKIITA